MADTAPQTPFVLVIDEFPYLVASCPPISSLLQKFCDSQWAVTGLHLILCGSSMSFMERKVLSAKSPLYGRRTGQLRLRPFDFVDTEDFLSPMPARTPRYCTPRRVEWRNIWTLSTPVKALPET